MNTHQRPRPTPAAPEQSSLSRELIWDLPIRICHWGMGLCSLGACGLAFFAEDDDALFQTHMLLGLSAGLFLLLRLALGLLDRRHNRLGGLFFAPGETVRYLLGVCRGKTARYAAHNPGSAALALGLFMLLALLIGTGIQMGRGSESAGEFHSLAAYLLVALTVLHLMGIALHTWRHREPISLAMVTGHKEAPVGAGLPHPRSWPGWTLLAFSLLWMASLFNNHDTTLGTVRLPVTGPTIALQEAEPDESPVAGPDDEEEDADDD